MSLQPHPVPSASDWAPTAVFPRLGDRTGHVELRGATSRDIDSVHGLIERHTLAGHLLPRTREDVASRIRQFVVAMSEDAVIGCAELAPLGSTVAEVRSLVVSDELQGAGIGRALVSALILEARCGEYERLCAFAHAPAFFVRLGFSIVPHLHVPEKVFTDCVQCPLFRMCGQHAVVLPLDGAAAAPAGLGELGW
jgi:amino-acid N-acetyltransferase